jgi:predicted HTH transcriptional regulator
MEINELTDLLEKMLSLPKESEWVEFKVNNYDENIIGKLISGLSNAALIDNKDHGYLVYGVEDESHAVVGTKTFISDLKIGNQDIEPWLSSMLVPRIDFRVYDFKYKDKQISIIEIPAAINGPVKFKSQAYIRISSHTKPLNDYPELERKIWSKTSQSSFESEIALDKLDENDINRLLDVQSYFHLIGVALPKNAEAILDRLLKEGFIKHRNKKYQITNLGALLFAKDLHEFDDLYRRAIRVIIYENKNKITALKERTFESGYAVCFSQLTDYINDQITKGERIGDSFRETVKVYPEVVIRELVANAIIHQDFREGSQGPKVEIFSDRMEITNSGKPATEPKRFIDDNRTRNDKLAALMRKIGICEERGSGVDRVIDSIESAYLPPPDFQETPSQTRVIIYAPLELSKMSSKDKIRACYQHCCLKQVSNDYMTNQSLRERFKIAKGNASIVSRIINATVEAGLIRPEDSDNKSKKHTKYIPYWA